jgi:hypothetical protein
MPAGPQRRQNPTPHLVAHIVPVERALRARADEISSADGLSRIAAAVRQQARIHGITAVQANGLAGVLAGVLAGALADEFRALADEMHHW